MSIASAFHALESFAATLVERKAPESTRVYTTRQTLELRAACAMGDNWTNLDSFLRSCTDKELVDIIETWPKEMS